MTAVCLGLILKVYTGCVHLDVERNLLGTCVFKIMNVCRPQVVKMENSNTKVVIDIDCI